MRELQLVHEELQEYPGDGDYELVLTEDVRDPDDIVMQMAAERLGGAASLWCGHFDSRTFIRSKNVFPMRKSGQNG